VLRVTPTSVASYAGAGGVEMQWRDVMYRTTPKDAGPKWAEDAPTWEIEALPSEIESDAQLKFWLYCPGVHNSYALGLRHFAEHTVYENEHMPSPDGGMQIGVRIVTSDHFDPSAAAAAPAAEAALPSQPDALAVQGIVGRNVRYEGDGGGEPKPPSPSRGGDCAVS